MDTNDSITLVWPPLYTVKKHPRAKHIKLKTSLQKGLEFIVPNRFNPKDIPLLLEKNKAWIEKQLLDLQRHQQLTQMDILPNQLALRAINQTWSIQYIQSDIKLKIMIRPHHEIVLLGNVQNKQLCQKILVNWLKKQAKLHLSTQLNLVSEQTGLPYHELTIRDQKTRWGSCSKKKSINLNYKLILFPPHLAIHILIHELCHTIHLNHSVKFWQLVAKYDPNWKQHRREIRQARELIPAWLL